MHITFWGVRGSIPVPGPNTIKYGGNTPCVEVRDASGTIIIIDAGTGIMGLGNKLLKEYQNKPINAHILISHTHWDHIQGFPFYAPVFRKGNSLVMYGLKRATLSFGELLAGQMRYHYFPVNLDSLTSRPKFNELEPGESIVLKNGNGSTVIKTEKLNHPGGGLAYRIEADGKSVAYICDTEQIDGNMNPKLVALSRDADILIHDSMFTPDEIASGLYTGWGHSSWKEALEVARTANAKIPVIFHHKPERTDAELDEIEKKANLLNPHSVVAREGLTLNL